MNSKRDTDSENRGSLRVYCKDGRTPLIEIAEKTYTILDISEDSVRFKLEKKSLPTKGELKFKDGRTIIFTGRINRVKDQEFVIRFKQETAPLLAEIIEQDYPNGFFAQHESIKEKRKIQRYAYKDKNTTVALDGHDYAVIDISETAIRFKVNKDNAALQCQGKIVFPDGDDYPVEGVLLRLVEKEAVLIFSSTGIPDSRIAKEIYESIDDYW